MIGCAKKCKTTKQKCKAKECRLWIEHGEDFNCTIIAIDKHGNMTLREVAKRLKLSSVRIKQIQELALRKVRNIGESNGTFDD